MFLYRESHTNLQKKIFSRMRHELKTSWDLMAPGIIAAINLTPSRALSGSAPADLNSPAFDSDTRAKRKAYQAKEKRYAPEPTRQPPLELFSHCYIDYLGKKPSFYKSFDLSRGQIYKVVEKDSRPGQPTVYTLADLNNKVLARKFYREQLRPAPDPSTVMFPIQSILSRTKRNGKEYVKASGRLIS